MTERNFVQSLDLIVITEAIKKSKEKLTGVYTFKTLTNLKIKKIIIISKANIVLPDVLYFNSLPNFEKLLLPLGKKEQKKLIKFSEILIEPLMIKEFTDKFKKMLGSKKPKILIKNNVELQIEQLKLYSLSKNNVLNFKLGDERLTDTQIKLKIKELLAQLKPQLLDDSLKIKKILMKKTMSKPLYYEKYD